MRGGRDDRAAERGQAQRRQHRRRPSARISTSARDAPRPRAGSCETRGRRPRPTRARASSAEARAATISPSEKKRSATGSTREIADRRDAHLVGVGTAPCARTRRDSSWAALSSVTAPPSSAATASTVGSSVLAGCGVPRSNLAKQLQALGLREDFERRLGRACARRSARARTRSDALRLDVRALRARLDVVRPGPRHADDDLRCRLRRPTPRARTSSSCSRGGSEARAFLCERPFLMSPRDWCAERGSKDEFKVLRADANVVRTRGKSAAPRKRRSRGPDIGRLERRSRQRVHDTPIVFWSHVAPGWAAG